MLLGCFVHEFPVDVLFGVGLTGCGGLTLERGFVADDFGEGLDIDGVGAADVSIG